MLTLLGQCWEPAKGNRLRGNVHPASPPAPLCAQRGSLSDGTRLEKSPDCQSTVSAD